MPGIIGYKSVMSPGREKAWQQQLLQFKHNAVLGKLKRARLMLRSIDPASLTKYAQDDLEAAMQSIANTEREVYNYRVDIDGSVAEIKHKNPHSEYE